MSDVVVIGAGASGLTAAIYASSKNNVVVLERYDKSAKKILVTGNGRCNYWNSDMNLSHYYSNNLSFLDNYINEEDVLDYFDDLGIIPFIKNGYYYPYSMQANSVREALVSECINRNIKIINNYEVVDIKKIDNRFIINNDISCDKLIVATGSNAYYKEENKGYSIAKSFGHNIIKVLPSLVQLIGNGDYFKEWGGVRSNVTVSVLVDNRKVKNENGEIMLTDYGVSGICVFNLSHIAVESLDLNKNVKVSINFLPNIDDVKTFFYERRNKFLNRNIEGFFNGLFNKKLINVFIRKSGLSSDKKCSTLTDFEINTLIDLICNFEVDIVGYRSFDSSQVCMGGVDTSEIDSTTMESKIMKNLYFVGEIVDVDGDCGGYNLAFAWQSGIKAGRSVCDD